MGIRTAARLAGLYCARILDCFRLIWRGFASRTTFLSFKSINSGRAPKAVWVKYASLLCCALLILSCRNARVETLMLFAQTIYLIFSSVYVCKEAVEHLLLSMGDGHHHHPGDEESGVDGSVILSSLELMS